MTPKSASDSFQDWVQGRVAVALRLSEGQCGGTYAEAVLILSSILSGMAADLWPGKSKDRRRFVEMWAKYADPTLKPNLISIPLLINDLESKGLQDLATKLRAIYPPAFSPLSIADTLVITQKEVDRSEADLLNLDPRLTTKYLRRFSYGAVCYDHVRSGYTHEYHTTDFARGLPMAREPVPVSYVNTLEEPKRRIYFDITWVANIVVSASASVSAPLMALPTQEHFLDPKCWWVDGG
jgi:hypothetical protein